MCGKGRWSNATRATACQLCREGTFSEATGVTSEAACQRCPNGSASNQLGASSYLACAWCSAGKYAPEGSSGCMTCEPNTYSPVQAGSCIGCPPYSDSPAGSTLTQCVCRAGHRVVWQGGGGGFTCEGCTAGSYSSAPNASACTLCAPGKYGNATLGASEAAACVACGPGTFSVAAGAAGACTACPIGTVQSTTGNTSCLVCAVGTFAAQVGRSVCAACAAGTYASARGAELCIPCPLGNFSDREGQTGCAECRPGTFSGQVGGSTCAACAAGTYLSSAGGRNANDCRTCGAGKYSTTQGQINERECIKCPAGTSSRAGDTSCGGCPTNTFPDNVLGGCVSCPLHSIALNATSAAGCVCPAGYFHMYNAKAYGGEMSYSEGDNGIIYRNHVYPDGIGELVVVKAVILEMSCAGALVSRSRYEPDTYPVRMVDTVACPLPFIVSYEVDGLPNPALTETYFQCQPCNVGMFSDDKGVDACAMCLPGTYQNRTTATLCETCAPGTVSGDAMSQCVECPSETYEVDNRCENCPAGKHAPGGGATACVGCPPQTWSSPGETGGCQQCPPWSTSPGGTGPEGCVCFQGLYQVVTPGAPLSCRQCPPGTYSTASSNACVACPRGTYNDREAAGVCTACPVNASSNGTGATACVACAAGRVPTRDRGGCESCPAGMVCLADGTAVECPKGSYTGGLSSGLTSLAQCPPCPANHVCATPRTIEPCPANTVSPPGSTAMVDCKCKENFDCTYTKLVKGQVVLPIPPEAFDETMRRNFILAVAAAAGDVLLDCAFLSVTGQTLTGWGFFLYGLQAWIPAASGSCPSPRWHPGRGRGSSATERAAGCARRSRCWCSGRRGSTGWTPSCSSSVSRGRRRG